MKLLLDTLFMMLLINTFLAQFEVKTQIFSNNTCEKQIITMKMHADRNFNYSKSFIGAESILFKVKNYIRLFIVNYKVNIDKYKIFD